jgi:hypothetical protein
MPLCHLLFPHSQEDAAEVSVKALPPRGGEGTIMLSS